MEPNGGMLQKAAHADVARDPFPGYTALLPRVWSGDSHSAQVSLRHREQPPPGAYS